MNPGKNKEWLSYHYLRRDDYVKWCEENQVEACPFGGQGLTLTECAKLVGVTAQCIHSWLHKFGFGTRSIAEAQLGKYNHGYGKVSSIKLRRERRDLFFENYRAGIINIIFGNRSFSNGQSISKEETSARRVNRQTLMSEQCPKSNS
jgi:hypothetical protein